MGEKPDQACCAVLFNPQFSARRVDVLHSTTKVDPSPLNRQKKIFDQINSTSVKFLILPV